MNLNQQALELLEGNRYDEALILFKQAVEMKKDVQSLTNLAWIYSYEEEDDMSATELLIEAIDLNGTSHFPYNLLGEIYTKLEKWDDAKTVLQQAISIYPTKMAYYNLAVAHYHTGNVEEAARNYLLSAHPSDFSMTSHVKCLIELGKEVEAKIKLGAFLEKDDHFVGEIEIADLYIELQCYEEAKHWFEKGYDHYCKTPYIIRRYIYVLYHLDDFQRMIEVVEEAIKKRIEEIKDAHEEDCDENWNEDDKKEHIEKLDNEKIEFENMIDQIEGGSIPPIEFQTTIQTDCYLFGCKLHNHPEY